MISVFTDFPYNLYNPVCKAILPVPPEKINTLIISEFNII